MFLVLKIFYVQLTSYLFISLLAACSSTKLFLSAEYDMMLDLHLFILILLHIFWQHIYKHILICILLLNGKGKSDSVCRTSAECLLYAAVLYTSF
jgi:hypothetical protein